MAILAALAPLDPQQHALGVDIRDLQRDHLGNTQARPIGDAQRRLVFEAGGCLVSTDRLLEDAQNSGLSA